MLAISMAAVPSYAAGWVAAGPFGGNAEVIAVSPSNPERLIVGTKNANLFLSNDAGETWQNIAFPRQYTAMLHTLVIDPVNPSVFYAAIADEPRPGLYRSVDSGKTWRPVEGLGGEEVYSLAFWKEDSKVMAAGLRQSVRLSRDGGQTWKAISPSDNIELQPVVSVAFDPKDADVIYAGTPRLPWKTTDGGASWNLIADGMSTDSDIITVRVDSTKASRVFIGACSGFWRSLNGGAEWSKMAGIPFTSRRTYAFIQNPEHPEVIFAGTSRGLYRTRDGGNVWHEIAAHEIKSLAIADGTLYIATADDGLFKSTDDGATLKPIDDGFTSRNFSRISEAGEHLYTGTAFEQDAGSVFASSDDGLHWSRLNDPANLGNESVVSVVRTKAGTLVASTTSAVFRSADLGKTWTRVKNGPARVTSLCAPEDGLLAGTESGIYRSTDDGLTWKSVGLKLPVRSLTSSDPADSNSVVALLAHDLMFSADGGASWSGRHLPFFTEVYDVAASGGRILAGTSRGLFYSEDAGETWRAARSGIPTASITSVAIDPRDSSVAFAFEYGNLYESRDAGQTWRLYDHEGLGGAFVRNLAITKQSPHNLVAVTATRGIFVREIETTTASQSSFSPFEPRVEPRKDRYVPNQQNNKTPAM